MDEQLPGDNDVGTVQEEEEEEEQSIECNDDRRTSIASSLVGMCMLLLRTLMMCTFAFCCALIVAFTIRAVHDQIKYEFRVNDSIFFILWLLLGQLGITFGWAFLFFLSPTYSKLSNGLIGIHMPCLLLLSLWGMYSVDITPRIGCTLLCVIVSIGVKIYENHVQTRDIPFLFTRAVLQSISFCTGAWIAITFYIRLFPSIVFAFMGAISSALQYPVGSAYYICVEFPLFFLPMWIAWSWATPLAKSLVNNRDRMAAIAAFAIVLLAATSMFTLNAPVASLSLREPRVFALLSSPPKSSDERQFLASNADSIRADLVDVYLTPERTVWRHYDNLTEGYTSLGLNSLSGPAQITYDVLASPLYYHGQWKESFVEQADELYERFFGEPIERSNWLPIRRAKFFHGRSLPTGGFVNIASSVMARNIPSNDLTLRNSFGHVLSSCVSSMEVFRVWFSDRICLAIKMSADLAVSCGETILGMPQLIKLGAFAGFETCSNFVSSCYDNFILGSDAILDILFTSIRMIVLGCRKISTCITYCLQGISNFAAACCDFVFTGIPSMVVRIGECTHSFFLACYDMLFIRFPGMVVRTCSKIGDCVASCMDMCCHAASSCYEFAFTTIPTAIGDCVAACKDTCANVASSCYEFIFTTVPATARKCTDACKDTCYNVALSCYDFLFFRVPNLAVRTCMEAYDNLVGFCCELLFQRFPSLVSHCVHEIANSLETFAKFLYQVTFYTFPNACIDFLSSVMEFMINELPRHAHYSALRIADGAASTYSGLLCLPGLAKGAFDDAVSTICEVSCMLASIPGRVIDSVYTTFIAVFIEFPTNVYRSCYDFMTTRYHSCCLVYAKISKNCLHVFNYFYNLQYKMNNYFYGEDNALASFVSNGARLFRIQRQVLTIEVHNGMANITITEEFGGERHRTSGEIVYYFSLPKGAVVTNLQLTSSDNQRVDGSMVARGAAQAAYLQKRAAYNRQSLLEEVGPSQYRLRVIASSGCSYSFSYLSFPENNKWIFPVLTERRNAYWDMETRRIINGSETSSFVWRLDHDWMTPSLPVSPSYNYSFLPFNSSESTTQPSNVALESQFLLPNASGYYSVKAFVAEEQTQNDKYYNIAVVVDTSLRMKDAKDKLKRELEYLLSVPRDLNLTWSIQIYLVGNDFFFGSAKTQELMSSNIDSFLTTFIGAVDVRQALRQFQQQRDERYYKTVILYTNQEAEFRDKEKGIINWNSDEILSIVYLGNNGVTVYSDEVMDLIESSGGNLVTDTQNAITFLSNNVTSLDFGLTWTIAKHEAPPSKASRNDPYFSKLAVRQLIRRLAKDNATLPYRHQLATDTKVVSSYSSLFVPDQQSDLDRANMNSNQFDRRIENDRSCILMILSISGLT